MGVRASPHGRALPRKFVEVVDGTGDATTGDVLIQKILARFFSDTGALTAAEATRAQLLARIEERNAESKRLLSAFSDAGSGGGNTLAKRLGEIRDRPPPIKLGEVEDRQLRALTAAQRQIERVARLLDGFSDLKLLHNTKTLTAKRESALGALSKSVL